MATRRMSRDRSQTRRSASITSRRTVTRRVAQRVARKRRDVATGLERHRGANVDRPRVGFGDDVVAFHAGASMLPSVAMSHGIASPIHSDRGPAQSCHRAGARNPRGRPDEDLHLVCVLKGAVCFWPIWSARWTAVSRSISWRSPVMRGTTSSGEVRLIKDLDYGLEGRNVDHRRRHRRYRPDAALSAGDSAARGIRSRSARRVC